MRKTTRGRNVQHIAPQKQREVTRARKVIFGQTVTSKRTVEAHGGKTILHKPHVADPEKSANFGAKWVHWKDTDAARRRGWSDYGKK